MTVVNGEKVPESLKDQQPISDDKPTATSVTQLEILTAENLSLRLMNLSHQEESCRRELAEIQSHKKMRQTELAAYRNKLSKMYNINFDKYDIEAHTGRIIPKHEPLTAES